MINKEQYQRTFGVLHASGDFLKEDMTFCRIAEQWQNCCIADIEENIEIIH